ncbi:hypothetical protein E2C01_040283 [Portunus trituberculatus]|uniref:Uncharacterized protein n=1 Tax=Portunus trituberculatus TaxID=210409 RepID=A0A5B7FJA5_PORTR|nr:hypothetical protein [Portunus trituberculatus]
MLVFIPNVCHDRKLLWRLGLVLFRDLARVQDNGRAGGTVGTGSEPVPRGIGRAQLVNTEYQSLGSASALLNEYQGRWRFRDSGIHQPAEPVLELFSGGNQ